METCPLTEKVCRLAETAGFARVGIARAEPVPRQDYYRRWIEQGRHGEMAYLARHQELKADPRLLLEGARSIIVVAENYRQPDEAESTAPVTASIDISANATANAATHPSPDVTASPEPFRGRIARYAWGRDYHKVLRKKLHKLADALHAQIDEPFESRVCVDTAPLLEREIAAAAGIGWIGKNTLILHQDLGSFFFLGEIITTLDLEATGPVTDHCGTCTRCLDACPTAAFPAPHQMDATRCISYLTIEKRSDIPEDLQPLMQDWLFGCDICQDVCPYNRQAPPGSDPAYHARSSPYLSPRPDLQEVSRWSEQDRREKLSGSAMKRANLEMLQRNARSAINNLEKKRDPQMP